jgi:hypothetical protein
MYKTQWCSLKVQVPILGEKGPAKKLKMETTKQRYILEEEK